MFNRKLISLAAMLLSSPTLASEESAPAEDALPERISFLVAFGDEKCPEAVGDEIIVCATVPEGDRYRIPVALRQREVEVSSDQSWASAVESLDEFARAVRPNSCSVNGSNGFTGCTQAALRQWFAERRGRSDAN